MYSPTPPTVGELIDELERKTRVPSSDIQIIFKGQKLHFNRSAALQQFGIFSGSRMLMVGQKVDFFSYLYIHEVELFIRVKMKIYKVRITIAKFCIFCKKR